MWAVLGSALTARRGQAITVALVAMLACAAAAAAPLYAVKATQQVGIAAVSGAQVDQRLISLTWLSGWRGTDESKSASAMNEARRTFKPKGFGTVSGGFAAAKASKAGTEGRSAEINIAYRANVCKHLRITGGTCPSAAGEVAMPATLADQLSVAVGDQVQLSSGTGKPTKARLVGLYRPVDPSEAYWGDGYLVGLGEDSGSKRGTALTVQGTLHGWERVNYTYDLVAAASAFATTDVGALSTRLDSDLSELQAQGYSATTAGLDQLLDRIATDRRNVAVGVAVGVILLLLLTWFALAVVVRETAVQVRVDVGWWRLHGAPSGRGWVLVLSQSIVPLAIGTVIGGAIGLALGRSLAGDIQGSADRLALLLSLVLVGLTLAGGVVAVVTTQVGSLFTPVRDLLRHVPVRRPGWRRSLVDLVLVGLAIYGVVQALAVGRDVEGLPLLAPGLAALAIALVAAWAVPPLATWLALRARLSGRLVAALITALLARRPETHRLFALVVVAIALITTAAVGYDTTSRTQWQRAALEIGADRVITVDADDAAQLQAAVRKVDPGGTEAMAVVDQPGLGGEPSILAVDSTRLPVVAGWRKEYGGDVDKVAAALRPAPPRPVTVATGRLHIVAAGIDPEGTPVQLRIRLRTMKTAKPVEAIVGPLSKEPRPVDVSIPACAAGCRLIGVQPLGPVRHDSPSGVLASPAGVGYAAVSDGAYIELFRTAGSGKNTLPTALLADPTRWRTGLGPRDLGPVITTAKDRLRVTAATTSQDVPLDRSDWAFVVDAPSPLPALVAGWQPEPTDETRMVPLPGAAVPSHVARTASLIPRHGKLGVLVDLTYADRAVPFPLEGSGVFEVWLSDSAPASIVADLQKAGLTPLRQESLSHRLSQLRAEGSAVGERFQAAVALVGLLLAAGAVVVDATRERPIRAAELAALRAQGVEGKVIKAVGYGGLGAVVGTASVIGLAAGLAGAAIDRMLYPGFVDGWSVLPTVAFRSYPVLAAAVLTAAVLGVAVVAAGAALVRQTEARP